MKPGDRFGPYDIVGALGAGGMGVVFRARDTRLGRDVALKTLPEATAADPSRMKRFEQEAQAASALNHPNVLSVFDVGQQDGTPYLVTELLEGQTLRERLDDGPLPPRKVIELGVQVAQGLAAVHEKGIVHRDLKPDNLFLTADGRVKILDFGVSRTTETEAPKVSATLPLTQDGAVMGTAGYMAPEQVRGRPADARSDVFALGAILYELATGKMAFPGETPVERGYAILNSDPPARTQLPAALDRVIRRCLEKNPDERFQLARDLAFALEAVTDGSGDVPALPAAPPRARRRWPWVAAMLALPALGAVMATIVEQETRAPPPPPPAAPSFQRVTFRNGMVVAARFATGGRALVYSGLFEGGPLQVFAGAFDTANTRPLSSEDTRLYDVSSSDELALGATPPGEYEKGMVLERQALAGGAPRPVLAGVISAGYAPGTDKLAVVRVDKVRFNLEYPPGNVLLETTDALWNVHVSPDGKLIAYERHPVPDDDRGTVEIIDLGGKRVATSREWWTLEGLSWNKDGSEVWFTAADDSVQRAIQALSPSGQERLVLSAPGNLVMHDVDDEGRALVGIGFSRSRMFGRVPGLEREQPLAWFDGSAPVDLSGDGKTLLFIEGLGAGKTELQTYLRRFDGSLPVHLGTGYGRALSPDGKWVLLSPKSPFNTLTLVPTGPGEPKSLPAGDLSSIHAVRFFDDGRRVVISGRGADRRPRLYVQQVDLVAGTGETATTAEAPVAIAESDLWLSAPPSPDGRWLAAVNGDRLPVLVSVDTGETKVLPKLSAGDAPVQWADGGKALLVSHRPDLKNKLQVQVLRYELATAKLSVALDIAPVDTVGLSGLGKGVVTPDARHYVYAASQRIDELYLVAGLR